MDWKLRSRLLRLPFDNLSVTVLILIWATSSIFFMDEARLLVMTRFCGGEVAETNANEGRRRPR